MGCSVKEAKSRIDYSELRQWVAYENLAGPIGPERGDIHAAWVAFHVCAFLGGGKRLKFEDFMLNFGKKNRATTWKQMESILKMIPGVTRVDKKQNGNCRHISG